MTENNSSSVPRVVSEPARQTEVVAEVDVVICGGGPAGVGAALAAAREGMRTVLIENQICLGGMATAGMVNRLGPYHDQRDIILHGIPWEVLRRLIDRGLAQEPIICEPTNWSDYWLVFDPEGMKLVLDELVEEAGVDVFLDTRIVEPIMAGNSVTGVIFESKSGRQAILAEVVIDATGDGDIAARAGAPYVTGRESDGLLQPVTTFFKCLNMDWPKAFAYVTQNRKELVGRARDEVGNDFILPGTDNYLHKEETYFNCLHQHEVDGTRREDISRAAVELRKKMWGNLQILKKYVPGCENISLITSAAALGVRETRRIVGDYTLTVDDVLSGRQFPDQVYRYGCFVDIHEPKRGDNSDLANRHPQAGQSYGVPYQCLLPQKIERLLLAGRCLSATHEALASVRMMPSCMAMGQAAGTAAAIAVRKATTPRKVDPIQLQKRLALQGVIL